LSPWRACPRGSIINIGIVGLEFFDEEADMTTGAVVSVITAAVVVVAPRSVGTTTTARIGLPHKYAMADR
jgi:hypothetical protein